MQIKQQARLPLFLAYLVFITVLFSLPGTAFPSDDWMSRIWFDKWVHIGIFFVLAIISGWTFRESRLKWPLLGLTASGYGLLIEFAQDSWIPHRSFDVGDWVADCIGFLVGMLVFRRLQKK